MKEDDTMYKPPCTITNEIINLVALISEKIGVINLEQKENINPRLRKDNQIKTIHSSLAIENNSLSLDQVTSIINGKRVLGKESEIQEVKNAFEAYELILTFNPYNINDLLKAHGIMMKSLVDEAGFFRRGNVGIFAKDKLVHMAPPPTFITQQMNNLVEWVLNDNMNMLIKSCIFHYEFEFIHPFADGNGRMGRMWHTLLLTKYNKIFSYLPIESFIKDSQQEYYDVLAICDKSADSCKFVEYFLTLINNSLDELVKDNLLDSNVKKLINVLGNETLSASEIMNRLGLKHSQTFRTNYLNKAINLGVVSLTQPNTPKSRNQKYFKI